MEIIQYSNGPEGAENSSKHNRAGVRAYERTSYRQSVYIAAISKYFGCDGLRSAVTDDRDGIRYTFDFYHEGKDKYFKMLDVLDADTYISYVEHPFAPVVIINGENFPCATESLGKAKDTVLAVDLEVPDCEIDENRVVICHGGHLWSLMSNSGKRSKWIRMLPYLLLAMMASDEITLTISEPAVLYQRLGDETEGASSKTKER